MDAVEDLAADQANGAWNPLLATGTGPAEARRLCDDALLGIGLALGEAEFRDGRLVHALLVHELTRSVHKVFAGLTVAAGGNPHGHAHGRALPLAGLAALAALPGLMSLRHRRGCCDDCCCDCGEDCCCDCSCECCGDACCDGCCGSCDCG